MSSKLTRPPPSKHRSVINAKVVLLGDSTVGKSSLVMRFVQDNFRHNLETTVGGAFSSKVIELENHSVKLNIWDTSGQERYNSLAPMYYRAAKAAIVVYDITSAESFGKAMTWIETLKQTGPDDVITFLAANKLDLANDLSLRAVPIEDGKELAELDNLMFAEVSAKTGEGVNEIFMHLAKTIALQNKGGNRCLGKSLKEESSDSRPCAC